MALDELSQESGETAVVLLEVWWDCVQLLTAVALQLAPESGRVPASSRLDHKYVLSLHIDVIFFLVACAIGPSLLSRMPIPGST